MSEEPNTNENGRQPSPQDRICNALAFAGLAVVAAVGLHAILADPTPTPATGDTPPTETIVPADTTGTILREEIRGMLPDDSAASDTVTVADTMQTDTLDIDTDIAIPASADTLGHPAEALGESETPQNRDDAGNGHPADDRNADETAVDGI